MYQVHDTNTLAFIYCVWKCVAINKFQNIFTIPVNMNVSHCSNTSSIVAHVFNNTSIAICHLVVRRIFALPKMPIPTIFLQCTHHVNYKIYLNGLNLHFGSYILWFFFYGQLAPLSSQNNLTWIISQICKKYRCPIARELHQTVFSCDRRYTIFVSLNCTNAFDTIYLIFININISLSSTYF
jgi:hypothetical protein